MTVKEIRKCIKDRQNDLAKAKKNHEEMMKIRGFSCYDKDIAYYEKRINELESMLPEAIAAEEQKQMKKLMKQQIKDKASTIGYIDCGNGDIKGITPNGKNWFGTRNWYGFTDRTLHCFSLRIEGQGMIFSSGTLETVLETVAQN